jgi:predicted RNase H-like HicB family nuclease
MKYTLECTLEDDGRWLAEVPQLYEVFVYSESKIDAMAKAQALALRMLAEQLEAGTSAPCDISMSIVDRSLEEEGAEIVPSPPADQAAYDAWLIAEVQEALDDDSPSIPHEEAMRMVRAAVFGK